MSLVLWDPVDELSPLRLSIDRIVDDFFTTRWPWTETAAREWSPAVEMYETDDEVVVRAELPNIDPKRVDITVTDDTITLKGETKRETEEKGRTYYRCELPSGAFARTLPLATKVKSAQAKATYEGGILEVKIAKAERAKARSVKVHAAA